MLVVARRSKDTELEHAERERKRLGGKVLLRSGLREQRGDRNGLHCWHSFTDNVLLAHIIDVLSDGFGKDSFCQTHCVP